MRRDDAQAPLLMMVSERMDAASADNQNAPVIKLLIVTSLVAASWALIGSVTWAFM